MNASTDTAYLFKKDSDILEDLPPPNKSEEKAGRNSVTVKLLSDSPANVPLVKDYFGERSSPRSTARSKKSQGYLPKELLRFLGVDEATIQTINE